MNEIQIFAFGGLGESGKNFFVILLNRSDIVIIDSGVKYVSSNFGLGIDFVIPNIEEFAKKNSKRIFGVFLSHAHEDHYGALPFILEKLNAGRRSKIPIYGSDFTIALLKDSFIAANTEAVNYPYEIVNKDSIITIPYIPGVSISFFATSHSIYGSLGICLHTSLGPIIYTSDYTFNVTDHYKYETEVSKLVEYGKEKPLLLMCECQGIEDYPQSRLFAQFDEILESMLTSTEENIFVTVFSSDIKKIETLLKLAEKTDKNIYICGKRGLSYIKTAIELKYLPEEYTKYAKDMREIDTTKRNNLILINGNSSEPFEYLDRLCGEFYPDLSIDSKSKVIILTPGLKGIERYANIILDNTVRFTEDLNIINKDFFVPTHAPRQDIKLMVQITKPKYILPVIGEYKHQILFKDMALDLGYKDEDILIKNNGDLMIFDETSYAEELNYYETPIENVDGKPLNDYNDQILKDRELMSKDGIIILSILYDNNTGKKLGETDIQTIGFEGKRLVQESLENLVERIINTQLDKVSSKELELNKATSYISNEIKTIIYKSTKLSPLLVTHILETERS